MAQGRQNVELKARDADRERTLKVCEEIGAEAHSTLRQRDTYFHTSSGRLKLREEPGETAQLIAYRRPDLTGSRLSDFQIVAVEDGEALRSALADVLGTVKVVAKERHLFFWEGVRIHLDRVEGLGDFIEFEAPVHSEADLSEAEARVEALRRAFSIEPTALVAGSYSDLKSP